MPGRRRQNERKSWVPSSTSVAVRMEPRSRGTGTCQATGASNGSGPGRVPHQVAVGAARGGAPGVEVRSDRFGVENHDLRGELAVEGPGQARTVVGDGRQVDVGHLAPGMDAGVGAPGTGDERRFP